MVSKYKIEKEENQVVQALEPARKFINASRLLLNKCTKPDAKGMLSNLLGIFLQSRGLSLSPVNNKEKEGGVVWDRLGKLCVCSHISGAT